MQTSCGGFLVLECDIKVQLLATGCNVVSVNTSDVNPISRLRVHHA
jgi:hypothetical protein